MANKLKNMQLTSVDLVRSGANQEADICLYKSAEGAETPTDGEKNILKRFIGWLRENPEDALGEPKRTAEDDTIEKDCSTFREVATARDSNERLWRYIDALNASFGSIQHDHELSDTQRGALMRQSLGEFSEAVGKVIDAMYPSGEKAEPTEDFEEIEEIEEV